MVSQKTKSKTEKEAESVNTHVRLTPTGRRALDETVERMGWDIGLAASACMLLAKERSEVELLEAMREHNRMANDSDAERN